MTESLENHTESVGQTEPCRGDEYHKAEYLKSAGYMFRGEKKKKKTRHRLEEEEYNIKCVSKVDLGQSGPEEFSGRREIFSGFL